MQNHRPIERYQQSGNFTCITPYYRASTAMTGHPCGKCVPCLNRRRMEWSTRMMLESVFSRLPSLFITLTYENEENYDTERPARNIQLMNKRIVRAGYKVRYCYTTEFGKINGRVHHHGIIWTDLPSHTWVFKPKQSNERFAERFWQLGFVKIKPIMPGKQNPYHYCTKYILKDSPRVLHSNKPRIGQEGIEYMKNRIKAIHRVTPYRTSQQFPKAYYFNVLGHRRKIYMLNSTRKEIAEELLIPHMENTISTQNKLIHLMVNSSDPSYLMDTNYLKARSK